MSDHIKEISELGKRHGVPVIIQPKLNNAFYINPGSIPEYTGDNAAMRNAFHLSQAKKGGVLLGESLATPTVMAHEIGHKLDESALSQLRVPVEKTWNSWQIPLLGTLAAIGVGEALPQYRNAAALTNLAVQGLSALPVLYSEREASRIAKEIYPKSDEKKLNKMFNSYLVNVLGERLALPGLAHLTHSYVRS